MVVLTHNEKKMLISAFLDMAGGLDSIGVIAIQPGNVMLTAEAFREFFLNKVWCVVRHTYTYPETIVATVKIGEVRFCATLDIETRQGGLSN